MWNQLLTLAVSAPLQAVSPPQTIASIPQVNRSGSVAKILPPSVPFVVFVQTNDRLWQQINQLSPIDLGVISDRYLVMPKKMTWRKDVLPNLQGAIGITFVADQLVIILPTKSKVLAQTLTDRVGKSLRPAQKEDYFGVSLSTWQRSTDIIKPAKKDNAYSYPITASGVDLFGVKSTDLSIGILDDYILLSRSADSLKQVIDERQKNKSLADIKPLQSMVSNPDWNRSVVSIYGNYRSLSEKYVQFLSKLPLETGAQIPGLKKEDLIQSFESSIANYDTFAAFLTVSNNNIKSKSIAYFTKPISDPFPAQQTNLALKLPSNTYFAFMSHNFSRQWQWLVDTSDRISFYKILLEQIRTNFPLYSGLELDRDVAAWMNGDYGLAVFPAKKGLLPEVMKINVGMGMVFQTTDRDGANSMMTKVESFIKNKIGLQLEIEEKLINGIRVRSWNFAKSDVFAYGWQDSKTLLMATGAGQIPYIGASGSASLNQNNNFRSVMVDRGAANTTVFFNLQEITKDSLAAVPTKFRSGPFSYLVTYAQSLRGTSIVYRTTPDQLEAELNLNFVPIKFKQPAKKK